MTNFDLPPAEVTGVRVLQGTVLELRFADGANITVDVRPLMKGPVFDAIFERGEFEEVTVDPIEGTIVWPNGANLDPDVLRHGLTPENQLPRPTLYILNSAHGLTFRGSAAIYGRPRRRPEGAAISRVLRRLRGADFSPASAKNVVIYVSESQTSVGDVVVDEFPAQYDRISLGRVDLAGHRQR